MNFFRRGAAWSVLLLIGIGPETRVNAQAYAPYPNGHVAPFAPSATDGTGNPFLRRGPSRAAQMQQMQSQPRFDPAVTPASFDQPIAAAVPQPVAAPSVPEPQPFVPPVDAAPMPAPQQLHGVAMLHAAAADPGAAQHEHPLAPAIRWSEEAFQQLQGLRDYSCTFTKREMVDGRLQEQQVMYAKVRNQPYSVYLQFLSPSDVKGQEALYVEGRNQGRLLAHAVGFKAIAGTISLAPTDPQAMDGNRHPITDFGVRRLVEQYRDAAIRESQFGECNVRIVPGANVGDRPCTCIVIVHPVRRAEFKYYETRLFIDNELNLPIHYEAYDWPNRQGEAPPLLEDYTYQGLRPNVGLTDADFDVKNPNYRF